MGAGRARCSTIHSPPTTDQENCPMGKFFTQACKGHNIFRTPQGSVKDHNFTSLVSQQTSSKPKEPNRGDLKHDRGPTSFFVTAGRHKPRSTRCQRRGPPPSRRSAPVVHPQLETSHKRSMGPGCHIRPQARTEQYSSSAFTSRRVPLRSTQDTDPHRGNTRFSFKESNSGGSGGWPGIHQPNVFSPEGRRVLETSYQLEDVQQSCGLPSLQDGVNSHCKGTCQTRRLATKTRPEGRLPDRPNSQDRPKVPPFPLAGQGLAVPGAPLWTQQCTSNLHKTHKANSIYLTESRGKTDPLPRRYACNGRQQTGGLVALGSGPGDSGGPRLCDKHKEECLQTIPRARVLGLQHQHTQDANFPPTPEVPFSQISGEEDTQSEPDINQTPGSSVGNDGSGPPSYSPSPLTLSQSGEGEAASGQEGPQLRINDYHHPQDDVRLKVVDRDSPFTQWQAPTDLKMGHHHRIRCITEGLGSQLQWERYGRPMDQGRTNTPHQLPGTLGSIPGHEVFSAQPGAHVSSPSYGQCHCNSISKSDGRDSFPTPLKTRSGNMGVVYQEELHNSCGTLTRSREYQSRLAITPSSGLQRLETGQGDLPPPGEPTRPIHNRPLCIQNQCTTAYVLQLASGSKSDSSRCAFYAMEGTESLHVPPIRSNPSLSEQAMGGGSISSIDSTSVAQPNMVSPGSQKSGQLTSPSSSTSKHCHQSGGPATSVSRAGSTSSSRLACVRRSYRAEGLSEGVINIIRRSWRNSTESTYSTAWRQWDRWCFERSLDPVSAPLSGILDFLYEQFQTGKQYRTINTIRSAISMTHTDVDGSRIGQHPLVCRFLKGVFNCRPPLPKYTHTWDVDVVLSYLRDLPDNAALSFQALTHKLAMLMALTNADRCSDLAALDLSFHSFQDGGVKFTIPGLTKTRRDGPPIEAFYPEFPIDPKLCPVQTLICYEARSRGFRTVEDTGNPLFIATRKPHRPVKPSTIGHWLKSVMTQAGINTQQFAAHSTRGAATSKAKSVGVSTKDILKAANWSSSSTFTRFYHRPVQDSEFGRHVLTTRSTFTSGEL